MKVRKVVLYKLGTVVLIWGAAYLTGSFLAMGFIDYLARAGLGG